MSTTLIVGGTSGVGLATAQRLAAAGTTTVHVASRNAGKVAAVAEAIQAGATQVRVTQAGAAQVGAVRAVAAEVGTAQVGTARAGVAESVAERAGSAEAGTTRAGAAQVGTGPAVAAQVVTAHRLDGNDAAAVARLAAEIAPIDALIITLAGSEGAGQLADLDLGVLRGAFEAKFWPTLTVLQAALPHLAERASITLVGAVSAHAAMPGTAGIGALNAAVEALVRPLAAELAPRRVNAVSPGLIDTPWWNGLPEEDREAWFRSAAKVLPVGHVSSADEIAEAVVLAATNPSMTGTILNIDGGARFARF